MAAKVGAVLWAVVWPGRVALAWAGEPETGPGERVAVAGAVLLGRVGVGGVVMAG